MGLSVLYFATLALRPTSLTPPARLAPRAGAPPRCCAPVEDESALKKFFTTNREAPAAKANQLAWARTQMDAEMPSATVTGQSIEDRADFVRQYVEAEKAKFGRELTPEAAEREIDAWLLKQATAAPSKTSAADVAAAVLVFVAAFGGTVFFKGVGG